MNRSRRFFHGTTDGVWPGEVLVATRFDVPGRGTVSSASAPLVAASLLGAGFMVRVGPVRQEPGPVSLFAVCYVDREGRAGGFAAAAHPDNAPRVEDLVRRWYGTLRSRLLTIAPTGEPCWGADASCPQLAAAATDVRDYTSRGDTVVVVGDPDHHAAHALAACGNTVFAATAAQARTVPVPDPERVSFVPQPGIPVHDVMAVVAALRARFPHLRGHHFDALCHAASDRLAAVHAATAGADLTLVPGRADDPDTVHLAAQARSREVRTVESLCDVTPELLAAATTIALIPARSAPPDVADELRVSLGGLGPLTVVTTTVATRPWSEGSRSLPDTNAPRSSPTR